MASTTHGGETRHSLMELEVEPSQLLLDGPFMDAGRMKPSPISGQSDPVRGVASLAGLDGRFGLGFLWHATTITPVALLPLAQLPNLGFLACDGTLCDDDAMRHISALRGCVWHSHRRSEQANEDRAIAPASSDCDARQSRASCICLR
jgi:hypothetical protein